MPARKQPGPLSDLKIALVQEFLTDVGGAEKTLFALAEAFPDAPVYTLLFDAKKMAPYLSEGRVRPSGLKLVPRPLRRNRFRRYLFPLFPLEIEQFDFGGYDIVISSSNSFAKGIVTKPETLHISYCHSPTRYLWDWHAEYLDEQKLGGLKRRIVERLATKLRTWDFAAAQRVDRFVANSANVARRITKYYRRESDVIPPPVELPDVPIRKEHAGYFLIVSRLEPYKKVDLAVRAFARMKDQELVVIGDGWQMQELRKIATPNVTLLGFKDRATVETYLAGCRAFVFPPEEDFGITPVEAMGAGKPVIAYRKGGALETVVDGKTGVFFDEPTPKALKEAVHSFLAEEKHFDPKAIRAHAEQFSKKQFQKRFLAFVEKAWGEHAGRMETGG